MIVASMAQRLKQNQQVKRQKNLSSYLVIVTYSNTDTILRNQIAKNLIITQKHSRKSFFYTTVLVLGERSKK